MNRLSFRLATSFRNRVILIFFIIIMVPFLLFAYYAHIKSIEGISSTNTKMTMSYLLQTRKSFEMYLDALNDQVNDLIGNKQLQDLLDAEPANAGEEQDFVVNMLTLLSQKAPSIDAFRTRVIPIKPHKYPEYMNTIGESAYIVNQDWYQRSSVTVSPNWYLWMPKRGEYSKPLLAYVKRFTGLYDQGVRGLLVTELTEDYLSRYFASSEELRDQKLLLVNKQGVVHYDSAANEWTGQPLPSESLIEAMRGGTQGSSSVTIGGIEYLADYVSMPGRPWSIVSLTPLRELAGTIKEINRMLVIFIIIYAMCCIGVLFYITARFTQPIAHLVRIMRRLESDNLHYLVPWSQRNDEVGWLYRGVGSLVKRIEKLIADASLSERRKKALEFQVLSHQINPHFLYNTLESIRWKAENHGRSDISEMVSALGNLLRLSLNQGKEITTLRREIEQVKAYVSIEQARMGKPIRMLYAVDPAIMDMPFLRLLLQPLVENAIQHSVRGDFERGKIMIAARREGEDIVIDIADNGKGIPEEVLAKLESPEDERVTASRGGVGLRNVNDRLKLYFGEACKLSIATGPEIGTTITLRHPVLQDGESREPEGTMLFGGKNEND
ncbi:sensor histidine kinase [Paenibacillus sp. LHD-117]|uniref:sensor histidine kinase n=1 Tax=Paenibacillus sp. LHD-117 TaxID=3071412 RepID=UPI0027E1779F|nr:sensor histidine kinase [Paenibacillus sp. LHD-117]MDQ6419029.1 sensor histidine kinase [Paenibacillus sp. LHD-117]